jgi:citrate synthase
VDFGRKYCSDDPVFQIVDRLYALVPDILKEQGKAKNPWPNVDAGSGSLLYHYGVKEFEFYTVFFGVSRAMGISSQIILNRALGIAITRPKSQSTKWMQDFASKA